MEKNRYGSHSVTRLTVHLVWATKYRYHVLRGEVQKRCRELQVENPAADTSLVVADFPPELIIQLCDAEDVRILKGVVSKDHVHMHIEYPPSRSVSELVKRLKGRSSRKLQQEFPHLEKRYWGRHFWAIGYGAWSTGNITEELIQKYLEHHRHPSNSESETFILEE